MGRKVRELRVPALHPRVEPITTLKVGRSTAHGEETLRKGRASREGVVREESPPITGNAARATSAGDCGVLERQWSYAEPNATVTPLSRDAHLAEVALTPRERRPLGPHAGTARTVCAASCPGHRVDLCRSIEPSLRGVECVRRARWSDARRGARRLPHLLGLDRKTGSEHPPQTWTRVLYSGG